MMSETKRVEEEIRYVRGLVSESDRGTAPASIYLMWAAICLVGFPLVDFAPRYVGLFWTFAGPIGAIASMILGWRHSARMGQLRRDVGIRHGLHWAGTLVAVFLVVPLGTSGTVEWSVAHRVILLILAFSYFLAGVHLERPILWVGLLMIAAYVALFFIAAYEWTIVGVAVAVALVVAGFAGGKRRVRETE
jgi:hypothetical protein